MRESSGFDAGAGFCAADVRAAVDCDRTDWGFSTVHWFASDALPGTVRNGLRERRLAILLLECVMTLFAVRIWLERWNSLIYRKGGCVNCLLEEVTIKQLSLC